MSEFMDLIGTKRYPLGHPRLKQVFTHDTGRPIKDDGLAALLRLVHSRTPFKQGLCYKNTDRVVGNARGNGWTNVIPFAGWLLMGTTKPMHHAWAVYGGKQVIDFAMLKDATSLAADFHVKRRPLVEKWRQETLALGDEWMMMKALADFKIESCRAFLAFLRPHVDGDLIENRVWGIPPVSFIYIGCPCDMATAGIIISDWHREYGEEDDHEGPGQRTLMQQIEDGDEEGAKDRLFMNAGSPRGSKPQ